MSMTMIALVDDDRNILTSVKMTLQAEGFKVDAYSDGQSALEAFLKQMPDVAVLDINLISICRALMAWNCCRKCAKNLRYQSFLTSKDAEIDEELGLRTGADDYIKKLCSQRILAARIRAVSGWRSVDDLETEQMMMRGALLIDPLRTL